MIDVPTRVKDALRDGRRLKEYRFVVLKSDGTTDFTIDNDYLVKESVKIDERMVTGSELKFGLCEGSSLEFQYFNKPNINGKQIQAFIDVQYKDADGTLKWQTIPMGWFTVDQCPMQFSTGIYKVTAYNKLKSEYLDTDVSEEVVELSKQGECGYANEITLSTMLDTMLEGYSITQYFPIQEYVAHESVTQLGVTFCLREYDPRTHQPINSYMWVYSQIYQITGPQYKSDEFYEISINVGKIETYIRNVFFSQGQDYNPYEYIYIVGHDSANYRLDEYIAKYYHDSSSMCQTDAWALSGCLFGMDKDTPSTVTNPFISHQYVRYLSQPFYEYMNASLIDDDIPYNSGHIIGLYPTITGSSYEYDGINIILPMAIGYNNSSSNPPFDPSDIPSLSDIITMFDITVNRIEASAIERQFVTASALEQTSKVTLRELQSAVFEIDCQYGKLDRTTDLFSGIELNQSFLYPADNLYPSDTLYPSGIAESSFKSQYSKLWTDMVGEQSFRNLIITYKGTIVDPDTQQTSEGDKTIEKVVNANGTTDYIMDNNWLFKNLLWSDQDVEDYADAMVLKMQSIKWFPFEMWGAGLPYIESGDMIEISDREGNTYTTYILQRQLEGIQNLQDTYINGELDIF